MESSPNSAQPLPLDALASVRPGQGFSCLKGITVLDLTTSVAGPYAAMLLGDFGAEVIKIERPGSGDDSRAWGPPFLEGESLWFLAVNRNKQSLALDYSKPEGLAVLRDLISHVDVLLINQTPRTSNKLGIGVEAVRALKPDIIYASITGFGIEGERADWPCYDLIAEGYSGVMDVTGAPDSGPQKVGTPAADMLAGQDAAMATLAALFERSRTGKGKLIDVALVDSMTRFMSCRIVPYMGSGEVPRRSGGTDSVIAIYQPFDTADLPLTLGLGNDSIWRRFWKAVDKPDYPEQPGFDSNKDRRARRAEIVADIQAVLKTRKREEWLSIFGAARIPAGPINRIDQVVSDPQLGARGLFYRLSQDGHEVPQIGTGILLDGEANVPRCAPPRVGANSRDILKNLLSYDETRIDNLAESAII